jgi:hypothetical protein
MNGPTTFRIPRAVLGGVLGGVAAGIVNVPIYFLGKALGATYIPADTSYFPVLPWFHLVVPSIVAGIGASVVVAGVALVAKKRAWAIYLVISALVFLAYLIPPFHAFGDPLTVATLQVSHVSAAALILGGIYAFGRAKPSATTEAGGEPSATAVRA